MFLSVLHINYFYFFLFEVFLLKNLYLYRIFVYLYSFFLNHKNLYILHQISYTQDDKMKKDLIYQQYQDQYTFDQIVLKEKEKYLDLQVYDIVIVTKIQVSFYYYYYYYFYCQRVYYYYYYYCLLNYKVHVTLHMKILL